MRKKMLFAFLLSMLLCASCSDSPTMKEVFCLENDTVNDQRGRVVHDFDGKLANDSAFSDGYAFCRQQQLKDSDFYYAVFPESNYVGLLNGELVIRLFQHQQYIPSDIEASAKPSVALGKIKKQKFNTVCGGIQVLLKGHGTVTALRFTDNDTIDRLWGNYVVRRIGEENQQLLALPSSEGNNEVWLDCAEGVVLSDDTAKFFTVMLPEGAFYRGFAMDVFGIDSLLYHVATEKDCKISRGKLLRMPELVIHPRGNVDL